MQSIVEKDNDEEIESVERPAKKAGQHGMMGAQLFLWIVHRTRDDSFNKLDTPFRGLRHESIQCHTARQRYQR